MELFNYSLLLHDMSGTRELFFRHLAQTSEFPMGLEIERAEGIYLIDTDQKKYVDLISGIAVSNLGHSNPEIQAAIIEQVKKNMHVMVYGEFIQSPQVNLATALTALLPESLSSVYFVNSGSEAVEGALKLAKRFTGRSEFISFNKSYHGSSNGALSLIGDRSMQQGFFPLLPGITRIDFNDIEQLNKITNAHAAVFIEPIQGEAGIRIADAEFLKALRKKCSETGTMLIFDEIQSGYGRTGKLFAFEHYNIVPDILLLAKGFGAGMPLGAFIASEKIMACLKNDPILGHITTFGGHPVSCAASLTALKIISENDLLKKITEKELRFKSRLIHPQIKEIRGIGLMLAVQLSDFDFVQKVIRHCIELGLVSDWFLFCDSALRIAPPLTISLEEIDQSCDILLMALNKASA